MNIETATETLPGLEHYIGKRNKWPLRKEAKPDTVY